MRFKMRWLVLGLASLFLTPGAGTLTAEDEKPKKESAAKADEAKPEAKEEAKDEVKKEAQKDPYAVPADAKPEELMKFVKNLMQKRPRFRTRDELIEHYTKLTDSVLEATQKTLDAKDVEDEVALDALTARFEALNLKGQLGEEDAEKRELDLAKKYSTDARAPLAKLGKEKLLYANLKTLSDVSAEEQEKLVGEAIALVKGDKELSRKSLQSAMMVGNLIEQSGADEVAVKVYKQLGELFAKAEDEDLAKLAKDQFLMAYLRNLKSFKPEEQEELFEQALANVKGDGKLNQQSLRAAMTIGRQIENGGNEELAAKAYEKFAALFEHSGEKQLEQYAKKFLGTANRLRLIGKPIEIDGTLVNGNPIDWASYKGKVVLVDFWATWCGPCIGELPNVKNNYMAYHGKGFDIVGISLDEDKDKLETFIAKNRLPWANLFSADEEATGWEHPLATRYGVNGIPFTVLVGKDGNVIKMNVRGEALGEALQELLGPPDEEAVKAYRAAEEKAIDEEEKAAEEAAEKAKAEKAAARKKAAEEKESKKPEEKKE